jgi:hypothetical protein
LTQLRVLDSGPLLHPAYCYRFWIYVDYCFLQYRGIWSTFSLLQGLYHDRRVAHTPVQRTLWGIPPTYVGQTGVWLAFVGHLSTSQSPPSDCISPPSYPITYTVTVSILIQLPCFQVFKSMVHRSFPCQLRAIALSRTMKSPLRLQLLSTPSIFPMACSTSSFSPLRVLIYSHINHEPLTWWLSRNATPTPALALPSLGKQMREQALRSVTGLLTPRMKAQLPSVFPSMRCPYKGRECRWTRSMDQCVSWVGDSLPLPMNSLGV